MTALLERRSANGKGLPLVVVAASLALSACVVPKADIVPAATTQGHDIVAVVGLLTLKGSEPETWFAVTDGAGQTWQCTGLTPTLADNFRTLQNQRVSVTGRVGERLLFNQIHVTTISPVR